MSMQRYEVYCPTTWETYTGFDSEAMAWRFAAEQQERTGVVWQVRRQS